MKTSNVLARSLPAALSLLTAAAGTLHASVETTDPSLGVLPTNGIYETAPTDQFLYNTPGGTWGISNVLLSAGTPVNVVSSGGNDTESFTSTLVAVFWVPGVGHPVGYINGSETIVVDGHTGITTGTFNTLMTQFDFNGGTPSIRLDPNYQSVGQATVTAEGGGLYQINSFFDIFTDLSTDSGNTWTPSTSPTHLVLVDPNNPNFSVPEPAALSAAPYIVAIGIMFRGRGRRLFRQRGA